MSTVYAVKQPINDLIFFPSTRGDRKKNCSIPPSTLTVATRSTTVFCHIWHPLGGGGSGFQLSGRFGPFFPPAAGLFTERRVIHACPIGNQLWNRKASLPVSLNQDGGAIQSAWVRTPLVPGQVSVLVVSVGSYSICSC